MPKIDGVGGKVTEVFFKDGAKVRKGQLLLRFDTRQAADEQRTLKQLIGLEEQGLQSRLSTIDSQQETLAARRRVLEQKLATKTTITGELEGLVRLELERPYLESQGVRIPLRSGMAITTNLKLREKRVISLISNLLVDQTDSVKSIRQQ
jgi:pyruvate/2-oxoglutarate dehydrogenase complex dihydrolipoamide acyltransferase (E2) component